MEKDTRNRLQAATRNARALLEQELGEQLEGVYDIRLNGLIAREPGAHLGPEEQIIRAKLVAAVEHHQGAGHDLKAAVLAYRREAAFTTLNRFVALKMLEARKLVQECVSRGDQSSGFREFTGLAPGLVDLPDGGYRLYLECLFDELGREVQVLFDRRDPAGLLWPRRQALIELLAILNAPDLAGVWGEDETIGWVYQYFNGEDERRQMRAESQVPRDSRELAVRNQFFTPRYVVQFLTDNTLGRTWYEMRGGKTALTDQCEFMVHRTNEVFLAPGKQPLSEAETSDGPTYVRHREPKDPRDLKILDPACGSGHFLLYAFGLLQTIYEEAWADDNTPASTVTKTHRTLREDYPDLAALRLAVPELTLRHNLWGVDIDARCAQIAALALWMRAQRAYQEADVPRGARPQIKKTNIVVAEPMPGEPALRTEFLASIPDGKLRTLVERVFTHLEVAGEAGSLLKIEEEIDNDIREVYGLKLVQGQLFAEEDEENWERIEWQLLDALQFYGQQTQDTDRYRRRLFTDDAARGFAFVDLCRQRYDFLLMNPPFGEPSVGVRSLLASHYSSSSSDMGPCFISRAEQLISSTGQIGVISNRTYLSTGQLAKWRRDALLSGKTIRFLADLGFGVLDQATVEAAAYIIGSEGPLLRAFMGLFSIDKSRYLRSLLDAYARGHKSPWISVRATNIFLRLPSATIAHWVPLSVLDRFLHTPRLRDLPGGVNDGGHSGDDFRFVRTVWEISHNNIGRDKSFVFFAKGGEYSPYWDDIYLVMNWKNGGKEVRSVSGARVYHEDLHFKEGLTYPLRTTSDWSPRILPRNCLFSTGGHGIHFESHSDALEFLSIAYTRIMKLIVEVLVGSGDASTPGGVARNYTAGTMAYLPVPSVDESTDPSTFEDAIRETIEARRRSGFDFDETTRFFSAPRILFHGRPTSIRDAADTWWHQWLGDLERIAENCLHAESISLVSLNLADRAEIDVVMDRMIGQHPGAPSTQKDLDLVINAFLSSRSGSRKEEESEESGGRLATMKSFFVDRELETIGRSTGNSLSFIIDAIRNLSPRDADLCEMTTELISFVVGTVVGRFTFRGAEAREALRDPFAALPVISPAMSDEVGQTGADLSDVSSFGGGHTFDILVHDPGHPNDIEARVLDCWKMIFDEESMACWEEACLVLRPLGGSIRAYLATRFFSDHLARYSKSRRKAPIYWQLATPSASYSVWLYIHRATTDTLYTVLNDYVKQKVEHEERRLSGMIQEAGPTLSAGQRRDIAEQETFVGELQAFRQEVARVAPLWSPDLNDGVIINFAPLWRLVPQHRAWQREVKACWDALCAGKYDWSHLAMRLWPERVVPKCADDRSLAIAHDLESVFWVEGEAGKWRKREISAGIVERLVALRTSPAVKSALADLLAAPVTAAGRTSGRRAKAAR